MQFQCISGRVSANPLAQAAPRTCSSSVHSKVSSSPSGGSLLCTAHRPCAFRWGYLGGRRGTTQRRSMHKRMGRGEARAEPPRALLGTTTNPATRKRAEGQYPDPLQRCRWRSARSIPSKRGLPSPHPHLKPRPRRPAHLCAQFAGAPISLSGRGVHSSALSRPPSSFTTNRPAGHSTVVAAMRAICGAQRVRAVASVVRQDFRPAGDLCRGRHWPSRPHLEFDQPMYVGLGPGPSCQGRRQNTHPPPALTAFYMANPGPWISPKCEGRTCARR
jgi:hypothetical protein